MDANGLKKTNIEDSKRLYRDILNALGKLAALAVQQPAAEYFSAEQLPQVIRAARTRQNLSQKELAALADISVGTMVALERGQKAAGLDTVERVLKALGLSLWIK
ncbi:helix-turn-helix transcriptional regulator [Bdellovibrionota bacterium FG-2]